MSQTIATQEHVGLLNFIERASRDSEFDVGKFRELLVLQRELLQEQARREFNQAMAAAQTEMAPIIRDAANPHTKSKYARLETIDAQMRPIYTREGFAVRFGSAPAPREGWIRIVCTVSHVGGHSEVNYLDAPPDDTGARGGVSKTGVQGVGSAVTYLRRYLLCMVFNIVLADQDDDGATGRPRPASKLSPEQWLEALELALRDAQGAAEISRILDSPRVLQARQRASGAHRERLEQICTEAAARAAPKPDESWATDPVEDLLLEIAELDATDLERTTTNAEWRARVKAATQDFPPDQQRIQNAIDERKIQLHTEGKA